MTAPTLALPAGGHSKPRHVLNLAVLLAGSASAMVIVALAAVYMNLRALNPEWPLGEAELDNYLGSTLSITGLLSVLFIEWGFYAMRRGNRRQAMAGVSFALVVGVAFLNLLWYLFRELHFGVADSSYATIVYALLTAAAVNAAIGLVFLAVGLARALGRQVPGHDPELIRAAGWYWDYVIASWLVVFVALYMFQHK